MLDHSNRDEVNLYTMIETAHCDRVYDLVNAHDAVRMISVDMSTSEEPVSSYAKTLPAGRRNCQPVQHAQVAA